MDQIETMLIEVGTSLLIAIIGVVATFITMYLNKLKSKASAEIDKIENEATREYADSVLNRVYNLLSITIDSMEVTLVKDLKSTTEDGKLTKDDQVTVANSAYDTFMSIASEDLLDSLKLIVGDSEEYLYNLIDSIVLAKKTDLMKSGIYSSDVSNLNG